MAQVNLYDSHYGNLAAEVQKQVRRETYGEDLGQASWITLSEYQHFLPRLHIGPAARVLEVACGSGGISVRIAEDTGAEVVGIDINEHAVAAANERAAAMKPGAMASFRTVDAAAPLPFANASFDALFCNDSINHLRDRARVLREWHGVLRPGGRLLYTDPIVITGQLSNGEIAARSSIGYFVFTPVGENERLLTAAGFQIVDVEDVTANVADTSGRWYRARERRRDEILGYEDEAEFEGVQRFLRTVHTLASERRLSRFAYFARRPA